MSLHPEPHISCHGKQFELDLVSIGPRLWQDSDTQHTPVVARHLHAGGEGAVGSDAAQCCTYTLLQGGSRIFLRMCWAAQQAHRNMRGREMRQGPAPRLTSLTCMRTCVVGCTQVPSMMVGSQVQPETHVTLAMPMLS